MNRQEEPYMDETEAVVEAKRQQLSRQIDQTREMDRQLAEYIEQLRKQMNA